jgi:4-diphosphocytidyl-2-C-methyl-D-erythritol kinase
MLAPAKINLSLYVKGKRADGYHELESLVTFADFGDEITCQPATEFGLSIKGEAIDGDLAENLILKAARLFKAACPSAPFLHFHLQKNLPVASGLGGGSSDAACVLRLMRDLTGYTDIMPIARKLGADVPVCIAPMTRKMFGIGHELGEEIAMKPLPALLVNPRIAVPTGEIFKRLKTYTPVSDAYHNDLQSPAIEFAPIIGEVISALQAQKGVIYAAMSGSGATCFALFNTIKDRDEANAKMHSGYWKMPVTFGLDYSQNATI